MADINCKNKKLFKDAWMQKQHLHKLMKYIHLPSRINKNRKYALNDFGKNFRSPTKISDLGESWDVSGIGTASGLPFEPCGPSVPVITLWRNELLPFRFRSFSLSRRVRMCWRPKLLQDIMRICRFPKLFQDIVRICRFPKLNGKMAWICCCPKLFKHVCKFFSFQSFLNMDRNK